MATRANRDLTEATIRVRTVVTSAVSLYTAVKDGAADGQCQPCTDGVGMFGIVIAMGKDPSTTPGAVGDKVQVAYLSGSGILPVKVGTGGATRGKWAKVVADGMTDATPSGAGTTATETAGIFEQNGVAGDIVGLIPIRNWITT